ncbi:MAG: hypothetical protein VBE63_14820 [Lamprobacter sp.]|uniref:hypothetical protein n=1 Tax=Lamprobacter sp. TaxID=3100796 RepID=UPI002B264211|nr:hypothetical protein [Lamprobacter sp.]MEA3641195.1 hypothetical protein [Lamprobacter sp.]
MIKRLPTGVENGTSNPWVMEVEPEVIISGSKTIEADKIISTRVARISLEKTGKPCLGSLMTAG